jgi:hypothetical protein
LRLNRANGWHAAVFLLWLPASTFAAGVSGVVLDSQDLPVPKARVVVACTQGRERADTDSQGHFALRVPTSGEACVLSVSREGFTTFQLGGTPPLHSSFACKLRPSRNASMSRRSASALWDRLVERRRGGLPDARRGSSDLIRYAQILSGTSTRGGVDLRRRPARRALPPLELISLVSIDGDPSRSRMGTASR